MNQFSGLDPVSLLLVLAVMAVIPFVAMVVTSYAKIVVVLGLMRNAIGVQQVPPNTVLNGIAIIVSCYVMAPVLMQAADGLSSAPSGNSSAQQLIGAAQSAREPFREFLNQHADEREKQFFLRSASVIWPQHHAQDLRADDLLVLAPAFLLTELAAAFRIGFLLYLAFIVVDIVVANILLAMGLSQVNPMNIGIPVKLLLFIMLDGWGRLMHGTVLTYQ